jgi:hypothetical protein
VSDEILPVPPVPDGIREAAQRGIPYWLVWRGLKTADGRNLELLSAVAPFVHIDHGAYQFVEELARLVALLQSLQCAGRLSC